MTLRGVRSLKVLCAAAALGAAWFCAQAFRDKFGLDLLVCVFHKVTGLYCPGCGTMRALFSLSHFDITQAFRFNPLFIAALPFLVTLVFRTALRYILDGSAPKPGKWDVPAAVFAVCVSALFMIARNTQAFAFLAPTYLY